MQDETLDYYISQITDLHEKIAELPDDTIRGLINKVNLLSTVLMYAGRVSSYYDEFYKKIYAERKKVWAQARMNASKDKDANAELAVIDLRLMEAEAYGNMSRWRNARESILEQINMYKLKIRVDFGEHSTGDRYA